MRIVSMTMLYLIVRLQLSLLVRMHWRLVITTLFLLFLILCQVGVLPTFKFLLMLRLTRSWSS
ncbi:hypothetical protein RU08_18605 [Pseudomonas fulva]|uniref:Uncharacterized protein n=1 Tax=Pseudomonas fulva TaxID=47880 RepID=A0A0D0KLP4_9PSED|nr:hypothetical protein RU08_18605 [Pseudomonas fulva]